MTWNPDTRHSLLLRLKDRGDAEAWEEFVEIYQPLLYRLALRSGMQHVDAEELAQEAFVAVAGAIERWNPNLGQGTFRGWLFRIARNMIINYFTRRRSHHRGGGGTGFQSLLEEQPDPNGEESAVFDQEYQRQVFAWAATQVRSEFRETSWQAFWRTAVEGEPIPEVAAALGISVGAVYMARSRVMARIKAVVGQFES